ncbi:MAG TPA: acyl-CoA dehydrogenase [Gammaproteobacteria bacterium]|nr:acyl-CoA dehydrogenase [Gammaproteobacteria bacterium]
MSTSTPATFTPVTRFDASEFLARAEIIGQVAEEEAATAEANRDITERLVQTMKNAQIPDLWKPKNYGGLDTDLYTYHEMIRIVSRHNMVAGWLFYFFSIHEVWVSYMSPQGRDELLGGGELIGDVLAPVGKVEPDGEGFRISGQWNFASGVRHCGWIGLGGVTQMPDGDAPEFGIFAVPVSECEIIDNWDTLGLRGTGSHGVRLDNAYVPPHRVLAANRVFAQGVPMGGEFDPAEPMYRMPFLPFFGAGFTAVCLGGAERMVNEFRQRTEKRERVFLGGASAATSGPMPTVAAKLQMQFFEMEGLTRRYNDILQQWLDASKTTTTDEEKAMMYALRGQIARNGVEIGTMASQALGATCMFKGDPVEMFTRDLLTIGAHASHLYDDAMSVYGGALFGGPAHPVW